MLPVSALGPCWEYRDQVVSSSFSVSITQLTKDRRPTLQTGKAECLALPYSRLCFKLQPTELERKISVMLRQVGPGATLITVAYRLHTHMEGPDNEEAGTYLAGLKTVTQHNPRWSEGLLPHLRYKDREGTE